MAPPKKKRDFDRKKIEALASPFTVTVEQDVGGKRTPITLPPITPGVDPGQGYDIEAVESLGQVLPHLGGGGTYIIKAIDAAQNQEEWEWWYDPAQLPRKATSAVVAAALAPPAMVPAGSQAAMAPQVAQPQPQVQAPWPWPPGVNLGMPPMMPGQMPGQAPAPFGHFLNPAPQQQQRAWAPPPQVVTPSSPPAVPSDPFADPLWQEREKNLQLQFDMRLQQAQAQAAQQVQAIGRQVEQLGVAAARPMVDPAVTGQLAELAAAVKAAEQRAADAERRAAESDARQQREAERRELLDTMKASEARTTALIEAVAGQFQQAVAALSASKSNGPDPTIQLLVQHSQQQQELNRQIIDSIKDGSRQQMGLSDVINLMNTINDKSGAQSLMQQMSGNYSSMMGMFREMVETSRQMQPPSADNPIVDTAREAIGAISSGVQAYVQAKRDENVAKEQATAVEHQARAQQTQTVANAQVNMAAIQAQAAAQRGPVGVPQPPSAPVVAAADDQAGDGAEAGDGDNDSGDTASEVEAGEVADAAQLGGEQVDISRADEREREIFGPLLRNVYELRARVAMGTLPQMECAHAIVTAAHRVKSFGLAKRVKVMDLYEQGTYPLLVEALLPDAPADYRREVVGILHQARTAANMQDPAPPAAAAPGPG